jgi:DNA-binding CsgD family transcriptional regulator/GAF domain-containing protein
VSAAMQLSERTPQGRSVLRDNLSRSELSELEEIIERVAAYLGDPQFNPTEVHDFETATQVIRGAWNAVTLAPRGSLSAAEALASAADAAELARRVLGAERILRDAEVRYRDGAIRTAREALESVQHLESVDQLFSVGAQAVCQLGFDRAIVSRVRDSVWTTEVIHVDGDSEWADEILAAGRGAPQQITAGLPEQDLIRRRRPILVQHVQEKSRIHQAVAQASRSRSYVAAPIAPGDEVIGFLHGDRFFHTGDVTQFDRDLLGLFAQGFSFAVERAVLLERFQGLQAHVRELASGLERAATGGAPTVLTSAPSMQVPGQHTPAAPMVVAGYGDSDSRLTRREVDVLRLMANGDTNQRIGRRLIISEGTVKSHVKHILRKLNAANRAEAVARWHQSMAAQG